MANNNTVKKKKVKMSTGDKVFTVINTVIMILVCIAIVYPLYYVLLASVTDPVVVSSGKFLLYPEAWYTNGYTTTLKYQPLWTGYANTIKYTVVGTLISLVCTIPAGYALSRYDMVGRKPIMFLFTFTMFFSGGMVPTFLVVQKLGLTNTIWAMIVPGMLSVYNMIVLRTSFESVPESLYESAALDGANHFTMLTKITLPLSKAALATITLFYAVGKWGEWYNALVYLQKRRDLYPLQMFLRELLVKQEDMDALLSSSVGVTADSVLLQEIITYATIIVTTVPILLVYPFLQKYFVKGVLVGSVKE